jgi:hypothetical protein
MKLPANHPLAALSNQQPQQSQQQTKKSPSSSTSSASPNNKMKSFDKEDRDEKPSGSCSAGKSLIRSFEEMSLTAPTDHSLRMIWDKLVDNHISSLILSSNHQLLEQELEKSQVSFNSKILKTIDLNNPLTAEDDNPLNDLLRRQVLSREQIKESILTAIKLQAGKASLKQVEHQEEQLLQQQSHHQEQQQKGKDKSTDDLVGFLDQTHKNQQVDNHDSNNDYLQQTELKQKKKASSSSSSSSTTAHNNHPMELSLWALDLSLSSMIRFATPRQGKPLARSREEIVNSLSLDKNEKTLIGQIISPNDIGVTYDQIGGLDEIKELLRQSITYPLKYPRLYQEGIASEAVKGVLLFGPPGKALLP